MHSFPFVGLGRAVLAVSLLAFVAAPLRAQSVEDKFRNGCDLYFRGKVEEALKLFQEVLAENPSNEQALELYEQAGREVFSLMLIKGGEFETTAKRFLELATIARKEKSDDPAAISALVEKAMSGNYLDRRDALDELAANHGEYGAGPFVAFLGDEEDQEKRANAIFCLTRLARDAVLPLLAALRSDDERVVRNACACLGFIRDARAVPGLKGVAEQSGSEVVRGAADDALRKIAGKGAAELPAAAELHVEAATRHFRNEQTVRSPFDTADATWSWNASGVAPTKVPAVLRHLKLAQQHCDAALESPQAQAVHLAALAGEKAVLAGAKEMGAEGEAAEPDASIDVKLAAGGPAGLSAALEFALGNDAAGAAVELLKALESMGAATDAVRAALGSGYKSVRYQAAFGLAMTGDTGEAVVRVLGEALGEDALRTVLVVDDRSESRNAMAAALRAAGYSVIVAVRGAEGFGRARTVPPKDVVVVRAGMPDVTIDQFVYDADFRTAASSLVIVSDAEAAEGLKAMYDGKGRVKAFVTDPVAADALVEAVKAAMPDLNHERAAALAAAERAAGILGHAPAASLAPVGAELAAALDRSEEAVLGGVLKAVGHLGATDAAPAVAAIFADGARSEAIRVAAGDALAGIFARMTAAPAEDVLKPVMDAAAGDASAAVRLAAGRALGAAAFLGAGERAALLRDAAAK
jgi:CheY-like chemotaxis protein